MREQGSLCSRDELKQTLATDCTNSATRSHASTRRSTSRAYVRAHLLQHQRRSNVTSNPGHDRRRHSAHVAEFAVPSYEITTKVRDGVSWDSVPGHLADSSSAFDPLAGLDLRDRASLPHLQVRLARG